MKKNQFRLGVILFLFLCCTVFAKVTVDWDKQTNFTGYKTYAWEKGTPAKNPLMDQRIIEAIDQIHAKKNMPHPNRPIPMDDAASAGHAP